MTLLAALGHEDPDRTAATLRGKRFECFHFRYRHGNDDLGRHAGSDGVVLPQEGREDVGRERALRSFEGEVIAAHHGPVADAEHLDDRVTLFDRGGVHIEVVALVGVHLLSVKGALDGHEPIAQGRSAFERERIGCLLHLLLRIARERVIATFEEEHALVDRAAVLVPRRVPHARRGAPLEVEQQAGATARQCRRGYGASAPVFARDDVQLAGAVRKEFLQEIERLVH